MIKEYTSKRSVRFRKIRLARIIPVLLVFALSFALSFSFQAEKYSRISWDNKADDDKVSVVADYVAFSDDVKMTTEKINDSNIIDLARHTAGQDLKDVLAYNITFTDKDGKESQPNARVKVSIRPTELKKAERYALVHIDDDNHAKYLGNIAASSTGELSFFANSFSIYAIIPTRETDQQRYARYTYEYYIDDELAYSQIVRNGDILNAPAAPSKEDLIFMGWYTENEKVFNGLNLPVNIPDSIQTDKTIKLHAKFADEIYSIVFYDSQGNVLATKTGTHGDVINVDDVRYETSAGYFVDAWSLDRSVMDYYDIDACDHQCAVPDEVTFPDEINGDISLTDHNIKLYPIVRAVKWAFYNMNDDDSDSYTRATYVPANYAFYGDPVDRPADPVRNGYVFQGWSTDQAGNNMYNFSTPMTGNITLYAQWRANTNTQYRIIFWKEALVDSHYIEGNYEYASHIDSTGTSGNTVTVTQTQINSILNQSSMKYYEFDHAEQGTVIHGDGSTIVNVYLKLKVYTVNFVAETTTGTGNNKQYCLNYYNTRNTLTTTCARSSLFNNGLSVNYTNGSSHDFVNGYSFTARMGEMISDRYPGTGQIELSYTASGFGNLKAYAWRALNNNPDTTARVSKPITFTTELLLSDQSAGTTLYLVGALQTTTKEINYWFEKPDGSGYEKSDDYSFTANVVGNGNFNGRDVTGFDLLSNTPSGYPGSSGNTNNFYYNRLKYDLEFYNYNTPGESHNDIRHGSKITLYNYVPERPAGLSTSFTFQGWYTTPDYLDGTEFDFDTDTMPMSDLMLYAKWENTNYLSLTFNSNGGTPVESQAVLYGTQAKAVANPTRTGYNFIGWRKTDGTFFTFDAVITEDTELVASWTPFDVIYVDYDPNGGEIADEDNETYVDTSTTSILPEPTHAPEGKYFVGWNVNGRIYYPGNVVMILLSDIADGSDTITIVAEWGKNVDKTSITYNANTGVGDDISIELEQNEAFTVKSPSDVNYTKAGHTLINWNSEPDGSGVTYRFNTQWAADQRAALPNILYAQWELNCHTLTVRHIYENGSQYDETETREVCYDEHYETAASTKDSNYIGVVSSGQAEGNMPDNDVEVVYTYTLREAVLTVNHLDEDGNPMARPDTIPYHFSDTYTATPKADLTPYYNYTADHDLSGIINGDLTINITYTKKDFVLTTQHKYEDGSEYDGTTTRTYKYLDEYTATPSTKDSNYHVVRTEGNTSGQITGNTTVTFFYAKKQATITTRHIDASGNPLAAAETQTVDFGDTYYVHPANNLLDIYDYTVQGAESGLVSGDVTVTYVYTKKHFTLTVIHKYENGTTISSSSESLEYGTHYATHPLNRADLELINTTGIEEDDIAGNTEVVYTYKTKTFTVTVTHIIEDADNITETHTVEYGSACPAAPKSNLLTEYTYTQSGDECGNSVTSNLNVIYNYTRKRFSLTIRHLDANGNPIIADIITNNHKYGDTYNNIAADTEVLKGHTCTTNDATSGTFTSNVVITFNCVKRQFTLTVHHIKADGSIFAADVVTGYEYGAQYEALPINNAYYTYTITQGAATGTITDNVEVTYTYTNKIATIIVHHVDENGNTLAGDVTFTKPFGERYETSASTEIPANYEFASRSDNHTGTAETTTIEVTYHYQKKDPSLTSSISIIDGNDKLTNDSHVSEYEIEYKAKVDGFYGNSTISVVNKLPYKVDVENSDFAGGTYDPITNTITWTENVTITTVPQDITIRKSLRIIFTDINSSDRVAVNRASGTITLDSGKERVATGDATLTVEYKSKAIVHYYLKGTTNSLKEDLEMTGLVGDEFTVKTVKIDGYDLVSSAPAKTYRFTDDAVEIVFEYTKKETLPPAPEPENPNTDDSNLALLFSIGLGTITSLGAIFFLNGARRSR